MLSKVPKIFQAILNERFLYFNIDPKRNTLKISEGLNGRTHNE